MCLCGNALEYIGLGVRVNNAECLFKSWAHGKGCDITVDRAV